MREDLRVEQAVAEVAIKIGVEPIHRLNRLGADDHLANNKISVADYFGVGLLTAGETIGCTYGDYPNVCRWIGAMKKLPSWGSVNEVFNGWAGSMKGREFERV